MAVCPARAGKLECWLECSVPQLEQSSWNVDRHSWHHSVSGPLL